MAAAEQVVTELVIDGSDVERASRIISGAFDHIGARAEAAQAKMDATVAKQLQIYGRDLPQSLTRVEDAYARLQGKLDPVIAAQQRMEREMVQSLGVINRAVLLGVTTEEQATRDIARLKAQQVEAINRVRDAQRQAVVANDNDPMAGGRRQILGYQAFDIGQGLAAGTPLAIIAAQQGPQIAQLYAGQGGLNALWKDSIGILGGLVRAVAPWLAAAAAIYGAYRLISSYSQEAALAIDDTTQALAEQAAPLSSVKSQIDELGKLQKTYQEAILFTGDASTTATDKIIANTKREFEAKKALLELEKLRQEAAMRVNDVEQQRQGLALRDDLVSVNTRMDLERQGFADPRIGSVPFVRLPDSITGLERTQEIIDKSPAAQKLKELRAEGELTRLTFERLQEALKATFDGTSLIEDKTRFDPISGRSMGNLPVPTPRGIDDNPGSVDFMRDFERSSERRIMQMQTEAKLLGQSGAEAESLRYSIEALSDAYAKNIELSQDQINIVKQQAEAYGKVVEALDRLKLIDDLQFDRSQLFRNYEDQGIASQLRGTGYGMDSDPANQIRRTNQLEGYRSLGIDLLSGIRDGALSGSENVGEAIMQGIADAATNYATKISDKIIEDLVVSGMKAFGLDDIGLTEQRAVAQMQVTAASVVITGGAGTNLLTGGAGVPRLNNPANSNVPSPSADVLAGSVGSYSSAIAGSTQGGIPLASITTANGLVAKVNAAYAERFQGFINELEGTGYEIKSLGGYNYRNIAGSNRLSNHASGNAIDINPLTNPDTGRGGRLVTDMPPGVSDIASKYGINWGGDWRSKKDAMHFEVLADKADATGASLDKVTTNAITTGKSLGTLGGGFQKMGDALSQFTAAPAAASGGGGGGMFGWLGNLFGGGGASLSPSAWNVVSSGGMSGLFASGTENAPPGWAWVGERGPELMRMRGGETIRNHDASRAMSGGSRQVVNRQINIVNAPPGYYPEVTEDDDGEGNEKVNVTFSKMAAREARTPGSPLNKQLRSMGAQARRVRR